ncbi:putative calcium-binding protein CML19 [Asparagus officinalis]|uniref:putative calcium-binding protein CML19 n=1 Tax=Asparagus officinalis TaxID=4686 RepID=UPI00098E2099|nr:putative calcium-binding protein CML19 [Asparagus officinalis]
MSKFFNDFEQVFHHVDKDGDDKISLAELQLCLKSISMDLSDEEIKDSIKFDEDGLLGFEELAKFVEGDEENNVEVLREAFRMFEMEGKGYITADSLKIVLSKFGSEKDTEECRAMICKFDLDGDGVLSFDEFKNMMT